jgi:hypothetical protein
MTKLKIDDARYTLTLPAAHQYEKVVTACEQQVATIQACPDYPNHPELAPRCAAVLADAKSLDATVTSLGNVRAQEVALVGQRDQTALSLRANHSALEGAVNVVTKGKKELIANYGGKPFARTLKPESTAAPVGAFAKNAKLAAAVQVGCKAEPGVICYLYQHGTDPANPDAWPKADMISKSKFVVPNLPLGQKTYFRVAIVRRNGGTGAWSGVLEVIVR